MNHFAKIKRQFNYLSKQLNKLIIGQHWITLSLQQRQKYVYRLRQLDTKVQYLIPSTQRLKVLGTVAVLLGSNSWSQAQITFAPAQMNPFNLVDNGSFVTCTLVDIDGDGDFDLFQGDYDGVTHFNENLGTNTSPSFNSTTATNPFGILDIGSVNKHGFVDIDGDGDFDLFMGDGNNLTDIYFFENTGTVNSPSFSSTPVINPFGLVTTNHNRYIDFVDIDNDGDMDLFIGEIYGDIHYYENTGNSTNPIFGTHSTNPFGIANVTSFFIPDFVDIDGDGDMDLFSGDYVGNILFFENIGTVVSPAFGVLQNNPFNLAAVGTASSPSFADIDNDGDKDLFVGNYSGNTFYFENTTITAVQNISNSVQVELLPNPASNSITIHYELGNMEEEITLSICTVMGIELNNYTLNPLVNSKIISTEKLSNGTYFYALKTSKGKVRSGKIVIIK